MTQYNTVEQIAILGTCKTAIDLLETKELLLEFQKLDDVTYLVYNRKMNFFLSENVIA
jgi:hypothetical protein